MKNYILIAITFSIIILLSYSCSYKKANCEVLIEAIVKNNELAIKSEFNKLCASYKPLKTGSDTYGQGNNFNKLATNIGSDCEVKISEICYACIKTEPPVSTFKISFMVDTTTYVRTVEISLTPYNRLQYKSIRE